MVDMFLDNDFMSGEKGVSNQQLTQKTRQKKDDTELLEGHKQRLVTPEAEQPVNRLDQDILKQRNEKTNHFQLLGYFAKMELARKKVVQIYFQHPEYLTLFAQHFVRTYQMGVDRSEIYIYRQANNTLPVQDSKVVQGKSRINDEQLAAWFKELLNDTDSSLAEKQYQNTEKCRVVHFMPAFLNKVFELIPREKYADQTNLQQLVHYLTAMNSVRDTLVQCNYRLVTYVAYQYKNSKVPVPDMIQEGVIGLIKGIDRFDFKRDVKFSTYAIYWIRQSLSRGIARQRSTVRLPFNMGDKVAMVFDLMDNHYRERQKWLSASEIAEICGMRVKDIESILTIYRPTISLYSNDKGDENLPTIHDTLEQSQFRKPFNSALIKELNELLNQALQSLSEKEAYILYARFGLNNAMEITLQDIADQMQLTRERVRQIQNAGLLKIKKQYGFDLRDYLVSD